MDTRISRSQKKQQAKNIEQLAKELVELSESNIKHLPCDSFLQQEIINTKSLKGGAKKRQVKYIAKELRHGSPDNLLLFLEKHKGSKLKKNKEFHELERLRDMIITEVIASVKQARADNSRLSEEWQSKAINSASNKLPDLNITAVQKSAIRFGITRKPVYSREIFRLLKAAAERLQYQ